MNTTNSTTSSMTEYAAAYEPAPGQKLITYDDIVAASEALKGYAHATEVMTSVTMDDELTALAHEHHSYGPEFQNKKINVFFKCENQQKTGSFKFRGGFNAVNKLTPEQKSKGVLAYSAGNHAQGIALSGRLLGIKTMIIMPYDAPQLKIDATRGYGAEIVFFDRYNDDIDEVINKQTELTGMTFVSPFDDVEVIAGQGTIAKEIIEEVGHVDHMIMGIGGGGLISGCAIAAKHLLPNIRMHGVEPGGYDDAAQSLEQNKIISVNNQKTIADGASTPHIGELNLPIMRRLLDGVVNADDESLKDCMRFYGERCKMIVEPTGCLGLAGIKKLVRQGVIKPGDRVGCVITGGNIDIQRYTSLLSQPAVVVPEKKEELAVPSSIVSCGTATTSNASEDSDSVDSNSGDSPQK